MYLHYICALPLIVAILYSLALHSLSFAVPQMFYEWPHIIGASVMVHEGTHIKQEREGHMRKDILSREGIAYAIQTVFQVQHLDHKTFEELQTKENEARASIISQQSEGERKYSVNTLGFTETLSVLGTRLHYRDLRTAPLHMIFRNEVYDRIERETAKRMLIEALE